MKSLLIKKTRIFRQPLAEERDTKSTSTVHGGSLWPLLGVGLPRSLALVAIYSVLYSVHSVLMAILDLDLWRVSVY